jgi:hypothetical protein
MTNNQTDYYVYVLFRENGAPFYVGKGKGWRYTDHERTVRNNTTRCRNNPHKINIIRQMLSSGWTDVPTIKIAENLTHEKACEYEVAWIAALGRRPLGPLVNMTNGGDGTPGLKPSEAARRNMSGAQRGKKRSQAHIAKLRAANLGKKHSEERCQKNAAVHVGKKHSETTRAKLRTRKTSEATRQLLRAAGIGKKHSEATRAKMAVITRAQWAGLDALARANGMRGLRNQALAEHEREGTAA